MIALRPSRAGPAFRHAVRPIAVAIVMLDLAFLPLPGLGHVQAMSASDDLIPNAIDLLRLAS